MSIYSYYKRERGTINGRIVFRNLFKSKTITEALNGENRAYNTVFCVDLFILGSTAGLFFVVVADCFIIYFLPSKDIAYEYVFVDGQIDFDCIIKGNKRKHKNTNKLQ